MVAALDEMQFRIQFERFRNAVAYNDKGRPFSGFQDGVAEVWEAYKPRLRNRALGLLDSASWSRDQVGSGRILEKTIAAIEIDDATANLRNNLAFWQNRFGHASRVYRALLEARTDAKRRTPLKPRYMSCFERCQITAPPSITWLT